MIRRPPRSTRTDTLFPYTVLFRSAYRSPGRSYAQNLGRTLAVRLWPVRISLRSCQRAAALHGSEPVLQSLVEEDDFPRGGPNWHGSRDARRIDCRSQPCTSGSITSIHPPHSGLLDRKSHLSGKRVAVSLAVGGWRNIKKKKK